MKQSDHPMASRCCLRVSCGKRGRERHGRLSLPSLCSLHCTCSAAYPDILTCVMSGELGTDRYDAQVQFIKHALS